MSEAVQTLSIPKRFSIPMREIWEFQSRLERTKGRRAAELVDHRRFRAAYDFLLLRTRVHEVDEDISEWWTRIQEVDTQEKNDMIERLSERRSKRVQQEQNSNEPNGNSLDYPIPDDIGNKVPTINRPQERRAGAGKKKRGKKRGKKVSSGRNQGGRNQAGRSQGGRNQTSDGAPVKDTANAQDGQNAPGKTKRKRNRKAGGRGRKRGKQVARANEAPAGRSVNARPRDEYGTHNSADADIKRVKVRIKKRISVNEDGSSATKASDDSSHF
jgi:poly(A) polymerase